jgi:protein associated with RNAse G/E
MTEPVRLVYTKYDGSLHWHTWLWRLGSDSHGVWLGAPAGNISRRGASFLSTTPDPQVMLIPADRWWTATFFSPPGKYSVYCDITTVPGWRSPSYVSMIDLDLDVIGRTSGDVILADEDEFAVHRVAFGYPADMVDRAEAAAAWLMSAVAGGWPPFDGCALNWLAHVPSGASLPDLGPPSGWL